MKKLLLCTAIAASLGLSGCGGGDDLSTVQAEAQPEKPFARVLFNPSDLELNVPNDALMIPASEMIDFTIELEDHANFDPTDPTQALGALDGWSTQHPFNIEVILPAGLQLDASSLANPAAIRIFEATQAFEGTTDTCLAIASQTSAPGVPCDVGTELQLGVDFATTLTAPGNITVLPLRPLKPGQGYLMAVTDALKDSDGRAVAGSTTWESTSQDIDTLPLATEDQLLIQGLVNLLLDAVEMTGISRTNVSYAAYFSTQSAGTVTSTVKNLQIGTFAQAYGATLAATGDPAAAAAAAGQFLPIIYANENPVVDTPFDMFAASIVGEEQLAGLQGLGVGTCDAMAAVLQDPTNPLFSTVAGLFPSIATFCAADVKSGTVDLPYYLSTTNPLGDWWRAACTSGIMLSVLGAETVGSLIQSGAVGPNNDLCQAATSGSLFDLNLDAIGINDERHLTKFTPVPVAQGRNDDGTETVDVQITVPNEAIIGLISALNPTVQPISKPAAGWPVVVIQHGITGTKEPVALIAGTLALAGFATVAIDHPLHGSRGITLESGQIVNASGGFGGSPTDYLNLSSLLTARDNMRQSIVDTMGLRLGLNAVADLTGGSVDLDGSNVHFLGQSLGSITGIGTVATANTPMAGDLGNFDAMFAFKSAGLSVPGGGVGGFLLESQAFGPLIKGSLLAGAGNEAFLAVAGAMAAEQGLPITAVLGDAYIAFESGLSAAQIADLNASVFSPFAFAAQTVIDSGDPNNYAARLAATTPVLMHEAVGGGVNDDGSTAIADTVIPNTTALPLAGTEPLAAIMGLPSITSTVANGEPVSGIVRFIAGGHSSLLSPTPSLGALAEMQQQMATYFATQGTLIQVSNTDVVAN